jgi:long-chain acyl-CoA synthetase
MLTDHIRFNRIIFRNQVFESGYLQASVDSFARFLDKGTQSNSPVVYLFAPNHIKTIIAFLGIVKTGRTCLLMDPEVGALEYEEMLADTRPSAIVRIDGASMEFNFDAEITFTGVRMDSTQVSELDDVCLMLYTAAEDGYAKAAMLTQDNLLAGAEAIIAEHRTDEASTTCALLPFDHVFALQCTVITPLIGSGSIFIADISDIRRIGHIAEELCAGEITHLYSVPLMYYLLSKSRHFGDLGRRVYSMISGGYHLPGSLRQRLETHWNLPLYEGYGLTETAGGCMWERKGEAHARHSLGMPSKGCRVCIQNDAGTALLPGEQGEICIQSPQVTKGYFSHPAATSHAIIDGWFHTGDYGTSDEAGNTYFLGLKKKMFNVAGKKVYPAELRRLLMKHDTVQSVELQGDYNPITGDRISAKITFKTPGKGAEAEFTRWVSRAITAGKIPQIFSYSGDTL